MASELVERLRTAAHWAVSENDHVEPELCNEAAARIEALEAEVARLSKPEWYFDDQDAECAYSDISSVIDDMDMDGVMRVGGARQNWRAWVAHKCLSVDSDGEPDETSYETFDTPEEAEKCWAASLEAARRAASALEAK